jgi:hypothetical protein
MELIAAIAMFGVVLSWNLRPTTYSIWIPMCDACPKYG